MRVHFILFDDLTQLDLTGPYEVLARAPGWAIELVGKTLAPVRSDRGLLLQPTCTMAQAGPCDLLVVPGGPGIDAAIVDPDWVRFTRAQAQAARHVFGICTGSLLLGAAGLLRGRRGASHWQAREFLAQFGAIPSEERLCVDGKFFTSGGVTSGIDMALLVVAQLVDEDCARQIQLQIEYDPAPPFEGGTPRTSPEAVVRRCVEATRERREIRARAVAQAASALADR